MGSLFQIEFSASFMIFIPITDTGNTTDTPDLHRAELANKPCRYYTKTGQSCDSGERMTDRCLTFFGVSLMLPIFSPYF